MGTAYCPRCQMSVQGLLCPSCGGVPAAQSPAELAEVRSRVAVYCYVGGPFTALYYLKSADHGVNPVIRFHAWQSLLCSLALAATLGLYYGVASFAQAKIGLVSFDNIGREFPRFAAGMLVTMVSILIVPGAAVAFWINLLTWAGRGGMRRVPVLGDLAARMSAA